MEPTDTASLTLSSEPVREVIELGLRNHSTCARCGRPMTAKVAADELWLVCATVAASSSGSALVELRGAHDVETMVDAVLAA